MEIIKLSTFDPGMLQSILNSGIRIVKQLPNSDILKILRDDNVITMYEKCIMLDRALDYSKKLVGTHILLPHAKVIDDIGEITFNNVTSDADALTCGFIVECAEGISLADYLNEQKNNMCDLNEKTNLFLAIEEAVLETEKRGVVLPDLCNPGNIFIKKQNGKFYIHFIDYDGLQINGYPCCNNAVSKYLATFLTFNRDKYMGLSEKMKYVYKKEINIIGLLHLYFLIIFGINISKLYYGFDSLNPIEYILFESQRKRKQISDDQLSNLFANNCKNKLLYFGFDDREINEIIGLFQNIRNAHYFGDTVRRINAFYRLVPLMIINPVTNRPVPVRKLVRK